MRELSFRVINSSRVQTYRQHGPGTDAATRLLVRLYLVGTRLPEGAKVFSGGKVAVLELWSGD